MLPARSLPNEHRVRQGEQERPVPGSDSWAAGPQTGPAYTGIGPAARTDRGRMLVRTSCARPRSVTIKAARS